MNTPDQKLNSIIDAYGYKNICVKKIDRELYEVFTSYHKLPVVIYDYICAHYNPTFSSGDHIIFHEFSPILN